METPRDQKTAFRLGEGDAWFRRNRSALEGSPQDWIEHFVSLIGDIRQVRSICDLGCANGWRLAALRKHLDPQCELFGIDVSAAAIVDGKARFPTLQLRQGQLTDLPYERTFDLVIASFVLHWIDRGELARVVSEIDRIVAWEGYLMVSDFFPDRPSRRRYHHLPEQEVYTFKQDYAGTFEGLAFYRRTAQATFAHGSRGENELILGPIDPGDRCACTLLHKSSSGYLEL